MVSDRVAPSIRAARGEEREAARAKAETRHGVEHFFLSEATCLELFEGPRDQGAAFVRDLGSRNGTRVDGACSASFQCGGLTVDELQALVNQARDERTALSAMLTQMASRTSKLAQTSKSLDQVGQKADAALKAIAQQQIGQGQAAQLGYAKTGAIGELEKRSVEAEYRQLVGKSGATGMCMRHRIAPPIVSPLTTRAR